MKETGIWYGRIAAISLIINMIIEAVGRKSVSMVLHYMISSPLVFLLNTMMIALPFVLLFFTKRKYIVIAGFFIFWLGLGSINGFLLTVRTTPFTASDLKLVRYGLNMITSYLTWFQIFLAITACAALICLCVYICKKAPVSEQKLSYPAGFLLATGSAVVVLGSTAWGMETGVVAARFGNIGQAYQDYGFPYCFSSSLFNTGISKPEAYGSETVAAIEQGLEPEAAYSLANHKTPNIIMIQLESFFDPLLYKGYSGEGDPVPFFRYLKKAYPSGYLNVPSVGAGTANTEFECITGMNLDFFGPGEYPYKTILQKTPCESMAYNMKSLGYTAHAIHNNEGTFYDRNNVFAQLGFDTFTPIEYMYDVEQNAGGWCRDEILIEEIEKALDSTKTQDFIYTISVQGHGAYPSFEYYCEQIQEMDQFIKELVNTLKQRKEPTVAVMYGDHLPGFAWEAEDMENRSLYQTQYVIWNNMNLPALKRDLEAYQLTAYLTELLNLHEGNMIRFHQNYLNGKNRKEEPYLADMKVLEYDILYGKREIYDGKMPYEVTKLQMGIVPVQVKNVAYEATDLLVYGENFNRFSKVYLDGKPVETTYAGTELLIVKDVSEKKAKNGGAKVTVKQVGRDKVPLGEAVDLTDA